MNTYKFKISTPDGVAFAEDVVAIYLRSNEGDIAIKAKHIPYLTFVKKGNLKIEFNNGTTKTALIDNGTLNVQKESTTLLCSYVLWNK